MQTRALGLLALILVACGGEPAAPDASMDGDVKGDGAATCQSDAECEDGTFCDGAERCVSGSCVAAESEACLPEQTCDEESDACLSNCDVAPDADGDGHDAIECGGDDCDDADPLRAPGNAEMCDPDDRDEDCDPTTFGDRDADGDGAFDAACCNHPGEGAEPVCGTDCDDAVPEVHPTSNEVCNGIDDNCNGTVDDEVSVTLFFDNDGDMYGDETMMMPGCLGMVDGWVGNDTDCDDTDPSVHPGASELCDGMSNDCDPEIDEGAPMVQCWPDVDDDERAEFGTDPVIRCSCGMDLTDVAPSDIANVDCDDDNADRTEAIACYPDGDGDGYGRAGSGRVSDVCRDESCPSGQADNTNDCCDTDGASHPFANYSTNPNSCGSWDRDCNGVVSKDYGQPSGFCGPGGGSGNLCLCHSGGCAGYASTPPDCGDSGQYITGCSGLGLDCGPDFTTRRQRCR